VVFIIKKIFNAYYSILNVEGNAKRCPFHQFVLMETGVYGYMHSYTCIEAGHLGKCKNSTLMKHIAVRLYSGRAIQIEVAAIKKKGFKRLQ